MNAGMLRSMERRFYERMSEGVRRLPVKLERMLVSEWAEAKRVLPAGATSMPGPFRWSVAPFMREIADCFSEASGVCKVAVMKAAQVTATTAILENILGYIVDVAPGPSLFVSADKGTAEASMDLRIDRMIASAGLADKVYSQVETKANKRTGSTRARKEFAGGYLLAVGPRVGAKLRSFPIRYLLQDEVEAFPQSVGENAAKEGDPLVLAEARTVSFEGIRKILYISTPAVKQSSRIEPLFEAGDRRFYYVPCKHCGHMQPLRWRDADGTYRLKYQVDELGRLVPESVHYECEACSGHWRNADKAWFLPRGEWRPTAEATEPGFRSYHLSALYSPIGMRTWGAVAQQWLNVRDDVEKMRAFVNLALGECFEERGWAPRPEVVAARKEGYHAGEIPEGAPILFVTIGCDVQKDRIELEVVGWGKDFESWSLDYKVLAAKGNTEDSGDPVWSELQTVVTAAQSKWRVFWGLIDEGHNAATVRLWCERVIGFNPSKGQSTGHRARVITPSANKGFAKPTIHIDTDVLKDQFYGFVTRGTPDGLPPKEPFAGYCHFPINYGTEHFRQLLSEEKHFARGRDGKLVARWKEHGRNERLDARVYATAALYYAFNKRREEFKDDSYKWEHFWNDLRVMATPGRAAPPRGKRFPLEGESVKED